MQGKYPERRAAPRVPRITRWSTALAIIVLVASACRLHGEIEFGVTLAEALQWQTAACWLLAQNALVGAIYYAFARRQRRRAAGFRAMPSRSEKASPAQSRADGVAASGRLAGVTPAFPC